MPDATPVTAAPNLPDVYDDDETGLEDLENFGGTITARIRIDGKIGQWVDDLSGETFDTLNCIPLGMVGSRILWAPTMGAEVSDPWCRSTNMKTGTPGEKFPWKESGFDESDLVDGHLNCESCPLKDWGSHPIPGNDSSWCSQQITIVVLREVDEGVTAPALVTFQRSSLANARKYLQSFANAKQAPFVNYCSITLDERRRGDVDYAVPLFSKGDKTDPAHYEAFKAKYRELRDFLTTPRGERETALAVAPPVEATPSLQVDDAEVVDEHAGEEPF